MDTEMPKKKRSRNRRCNTGIMANDITREQLQQWFHLPTHEACARLGISLSVLKRICRRRGIERWPYRPFATPQQPMSNRHANSSCTSSTPSQPTTPFSELPNSPADAMHSTLHKPPSLQHPGDSPPNMSPLHLSQHAKQGAQNVDNILLNNGLELLNAAVNRLEPSVCGNKTQGSHQASLAQQPQQRWWEQLLPPEHLKQQQLPQQQWWEQLPPPPQQQQPQQRWWELVPQEQQQPGAQGGREDGRHWYASRSRSAFRPWDSQQQQQHVLWGAVGALQQQLQQNAILQQYPASSSVTGGIMNSRLASWNSDATQLTAAYLQHAASANSARQAELAATLTRQLLNCTAVGGTQGAGQGRADVELSLDPAEGIGCSPAAGRHIFAPAQSSKSGFAFPSSQRHSSPVISWPTVPASAPPVDVTPSPAALLRYAAVVAALARSGDAPGAGGSSESNDSLYRCSEAAEAVWLPRSANGLESMCVEVQPRASQSSQAAVRDLQEAMLLGRSSPPLSDRTTPTGVVPFGSGDISATAVICTLDSDTKDPSLPAASNMAGEPSRSPSQSAVPVCEGTMAPAAASSPASSQPHPSKTRELVSLLERGVGILQRQPNHPLARQLTAATRDAVVLLSQAERPQDAAEASDEWTELPTLELQEKGSGCYSESPEQSGEQSPSDAQQSPVESGKVLARLMKKKVAWHCLRKFAAKRGYKIERVERVKRQETDCES